LGRQEEKSLLAVFPWRLGGLAFITILPDFLIDSHISCDIVPRPQWREMS
jgi:hypothetical protein